MPQAQVTTDVFFGNQAMPNGQGVMSWLALNDGTNWIIENTGNLDLDYRKIGSAQMAYRRRAVYLSDDKGPRTLSVLAAYRGASPIGAALAQLSEAGEQYLSFDNKATGILAKLAAAPNRKLKTPSNLTYWNVELEFFAKQSWFQDLAASSVAGFAVAGTTGGSTTTQGVTYAGSVATEPVWTLAVTAGNPATIASVVFKNVMSGETLTVVIPTPLAGSTAWTLTIDSGNSSVVDQHGAAYDISGSFPMLYGPAGQAQNIAVTVTTGTGTLSNATASASYLNRWEI